MTLVYHYFPTSHWSRVISLVIAEKGIEVERQVVDIRHNATFDPAYMRLNPKGVVPTLVHDGSAVTNSLRIASHLDEVASPALYTGLEDEHVDAWVKRLETFPLMLFSYSVWVLGQRGERSASILDDKIERAARYADAHPALRAEYTRKKAFFETFRAQVQDDAFVAAELERWGEVLDEIARCADPWIAGETYSFADCIATSILYRLVDLERLDAWHGDESHGLHRYYARLCARPSFAAVFSNDPNIL